MQERRHGVTVSKCGHTVLVSGDFDVPRDKLREVAALQLAESIADEPGAMN